ncbi:MAG: NAD+ synthase, partial [Candidatus Aenigmatarchaeota archaeon]
KGYLKGKDELFGELCPSVDELIEFIRNKTGDGSSPESFHTNVIGLSGGIDSSVVASFAVRAVGAENVYGVMLPSESNQSEDLEFAVEHAEALNIEYDIIPIKSICESFFDVEGYFKSKLRKGNLRARVRMALLYDRAAGRGGRVIGTGNRSEYLTGYFTKFGDGAVDIEPLLPLYKVQVRKIARELGVAEKIIERPPSAGLWEGQTDEDELGIDYEDLDRILLGRDLNFGPEEISEAKEIPPDEVERIFSIIRRTEHKRRLPPGPRLNLNSDRGDYHE